MLAFDVQDPFPLLPLLRRDDASLGQRYREEQDHAARADEWVGLRTAEAESAASRTPPSAHAIRTQNLWIGLPVPTLLTPYTEFRALLDRAGVGPGDHVVDLGAGYGRMAFVILEHFPGVRFTGYEYVPARVQASLYALRSDRWRQSQARHGETIDIIEADLRSPDFSLSPADTYFLYDYGSREAIDKTLDDLRAIARRAPIRVLGRGRASRDAIERRHPWLSQVEPPEHFLNTSIYRSAS